jgi:hypothetical protein
MAVRKTSLLYAAVVLFFSLTASVQASPNLQDLGDAITQALDATAGELISGGPIERISGPLSDVPYWKIRANRTYEDINSVEFPRGQQNNRRVGPAAGRSVCVDPAGQRDHHSAWRYANLGG